MVEVGMTQREVIDAHDLLRPQIRRDDSLARIEAAVGAAGIDHHHARAGKSHHRAVALAHRQERHAQIGIEEAVVDPVSRVNRQHGRQRDRASRAPSEFATGFRIGNSISRDRFAVIATASGASSQSIRNA